MDHIKIEIPVAEGGTRDFLIAQLLEVGFEGFEETESNLSAYIQESAFLPGSLNNILSELDLEFKLEKIPDQNWNAVWEENFQPVIVDNFCTIKADFHKIKANTPYQIIITPKMSFGTGHHATTRQMMLQMKNIYFIGKKVLDFGTGTGILAILSEMLGAKEVVAIDNDEWSYTNANENIIHNNCKKIELLKGSLEAVDRANFDIILANINRHILLEQMASLKLLLNKDGLLLLSGLLEEDREIIESSAKGVGLELVKATELNKWACLLFIR
jgi:ribosomal protein L11 methyltransferase